ncbi:MAG: CpXC domain-containing protein [Treponemataceae bacterium]
MRTIVCSCDASFDADLPDSIDLDQQPQQVEALLSGSFMTVTCPTCGRKLKPEFPLRLTWGSRGVKLYVIPELDRPELAEMDEKGIESIFVVGYPELADRIAVISADLEPMAIEALKYYLLVKAAEADPNAEASAWFHALNADTIDFHVHGLRPGEVAVSKVPRSLYERTLAEFRAHPDSEPFRSIQNGKYISVQNLFKSEE